VEILITGIIAGVLGTILMDLSNLLLARTNIVTKIDIKMIGRMSAGWSRWRFFYYHPSEIQPVKNEKLFGYISHYLIGVFLSLIFMFGWDSIVGGPVSAIWVFVYGTATTVVSLFFVYPSLGLGIAGMQSTEGIKNPVSSIANHTFFGAGMAIAVLIL